ncbi:MAG: hypothetical protein FGM33_07180 [Candidatus Kapabacteria bacterium]|nr:hypothetical protein [Candidatus Kapabacteria bacterium]
MRGIRTLFLAMIIAVGAIVSNAQVTVFVRSAADGGNNANNGLTAATAKLTIGGANGALAVAGVTTLDIGAGNFAGATTTVPLTINGANAGAALANWGAATVLTTPITLGAADADIAVDGVTFGAGSTINGASTAANVIASNCKFSAANAINTTGLGWEELSISGCQFDGNNGGAAANAIVADGLTTLFLTETTFEDYTSSAVTVSGSHENVVMTSNEFTRVNTGGTTSEGAMKIDAAGLSTAGSLRVANNIVGGATTTNGVVVSGALAGKTINVESNLFSGLAGFAIRNNGSGMLAAGCNAYGPNASITTVMGLLNGAIQAGPYNLGAIDDNGAAIGFIPVANSCNTDGPVTITGSTNSYFRIQDGVSAVASGGTVTAGLYTFTENVNVNKSLTLTSTNSIDDYTRATPWTTLNGTITVTIGAVNFGLTGFKVTSTTATQLVTSSATGSTNILNCLIDVKPTLGLSAVPTNGAIHILKNGDVNINGSKVGRPSTGTAPFIRALTFGAGNACRNVSIGTVSSNLIEGTLQFSGMSLLSNVTITNSTISNAGVDGVSFTGNTINQLSITGCDILNSRQNGIGIRDRVTVGNVSAAITNNEITGSGQSGSGFAAVSISSTSFGTQSYTGNILAPQNGSNKLFVNDRSGYNPVVTCNWWGTKSQDVIEANITGGSVIDDGTSGWYRSNASTGGNGANFDAGSGATCSVRAFTITLAPTNATCFGSSTGSINNTLGGESAGATYAWSTGATTEDVSNLAAGTYSVTVTTASENTRSKSATILEPTQLAGTTAKTNITCFSLVDGTITVSNPAGGVINAITPTYNYRIDRAGGPVGDVGPQASASFTGLGAGTYDVYLIAQGVSPVCERVIGTQVIVEPTQINGSGAVTSNYNGAQIKCPTSTDGQITVTASGGTGALQYKLGAGSYQVSNIFNGLGAGTYTPTVKDANNCERTLANVVITAPTPISGSGTVTSDYNGAQISCPGESNGQITITAAGGTSTLNYKLNSGTYQASNIFNGLAAGTYTPTVKDANDCEKVLTAVVITPPVQLTVASAVKKSYNGADLSCHNSTDGEITVTAAGGTGAKTYSIDNGTSYQSGTVFSNLAAGTYNVRIKDANNCVTAATQVVVVAPTQLTVASAVKKSYNGADLSCHNSTDGEITVTAAGGTGAKTYSINNGSTYQSGTVFSSLAAGTYNVKIKDANNCETAATQVVIVAPTQLTVASAVKKSYNGVDLSCHNSTDGEITVTAAGGTGAKTYSINNGGTYQSGAVFSNLAAGTYNVKIKDANNCETAATQVVIVAPTQLTIASAVKTQYNGADLSCHNSTNGEITVTAAGGTGTKQYSLDNGSNWQASNIFSNLAAGTYKMKIRDANDCQTLPTVVEIVAPVELTIVSAVKTQYNGRDLRCHNSADGEITVAANGGTGARQFSKDNGATWQVSNVFSNLAAGSYQMRVRDVNSCTTAVTNVTIIAPPAVASAPAVTSNYNGAQLTCPNSSDGTIAANASGGTTPYTYQWQKFNGASWGSPGAMNATMATITGVNAGTYRVTVTDVNLCAITNTVEVIPPAPAVILTLTKTPAVRYNGRDVSCFGASDGTVTVIATGGTGNLKYSSNGGTTWLTGGTLTPGGDPTYTFTGLGAGTYTVVVQDVNNCVSDPQTISLQNPPLLQISSLVTNGPVNAGESITFTATVTGGTRQATANKYSYAWQKPRTQANMPGFGSETVNVNDVVTTFTIPVTTPDDNGFSTNYILTVTDANGCTAVLSIQPIIYPPTIHVTTTGNDLTGDGRTVNPLRTIQKAIDVADPSNTIEVAAGVYDESPVVSKALTINGTATTTLGSGRYFIYGTPNTITWGTSWPTSVWDNLGLNGDGASAIGTVMAKVNSNANATLWLIGNITWNGTIEVSKQLAIRGATASAAVPSYTGCDIAPPTTINYTGAGANNVLFKFTGTTTKSLRDLVLQIPFAGIFAEIPTGSSCNVEPVTNVRFDWDHDNNSLTDRRRMFGVTNGAFSVNQTFDVAKLINDVADNGYGSGRVVYGNNGPLPWNSLEIGWKAEDGGVENAGDKIKTLEPMKSTVKLQSLISNGRRPSLNTTAGNFNGKWSMDFDATANQYLEANTTTEINGGAKKTLFVVFRPLDGADDQVIYKHGDQTNGMSIVHLADGRISMNIYDGTAVDKRESWIFESSASSHSETGFDNEVLIAQVYFNGDGDNNATRRVGASLDRESGRINSDVNHTGAEKTNGYVGNGAFTSATLATPGTIGPANVAVVGARSGSMYYASWSGTASADNSLTSTGRSLFYNGSIAEVLILNTAAESTRDAAYCYLRNKYYGGSQSTQNGLDKRVIAGDVREEIETVSAWPNPADDRVSIEAMIPTSGMVTVTLRDALGRVAQVLHEEYVPGGTLLPINADVRNLVSGAYVIHVSAAGDVNLSLPLVIRH